MKKSYKDLLSQKQYLKIIAANAINRFGDSIDMIAFGWMAYTLTRSEVWMALVFLANSIPNLVLQPLVSVYVQGLDKKMTLVLCHVGRGLLVTLTAALLHLGMIQPWMLLAFTFLMSTFEAISVPAAVSMVPMILEKEKYDFGLSLNQSVAQVAMLVGTAAAGTIVGVFGVPAALLIDALSFFAAAAITHAVIVKEVLVPVKHTVKSYLLDLRDGFRYFRSVNELFILAIFAFFISIIFGSMAIQTPYVVDRLRMDAVFLSYIGIISTVGIIVSSLGYPYLKKRVRNQLIFGGGGILVGAGFISMFFIDYTMGKALIYALFLGVSLVLGFGMGFIQTSLNVSFMSHVSTPMLPKAGAIFNSVSYAAQAIGALVLSVVLILLSSHEVFLVYGFLCILTFAILIMNKGLRNL